MRRPIKLLLLFAAFLFCGDATASLVSFSEHGSPAIEDAAQSGFSAIDSPATPYHFPAGKQAKQIIFLSEILSDSELKDSREIPARFSEGSVANRKRVTGALFDSRIIDPGNSLKKIIFPFHSFF